jgi:hypothetical protein
MPFAALGKMLMLLGLALLVVGALLAWGPRLPWVGRLPGDVVIGGANWKVYVPLGTWLLISAVASLLLWLFRRR